MTDTTPDTPPVDTSSSKAAPQKTEAATNKKESGAAKAVSSHRTKSGWRPAFWVLFILLVVLLAGGWYLNERAEASRNELSAAARQSALAAQQAHERAEQALAHSARLENTLSGLQSRVEGTHNRLGDLDKALQMLSDKGSDLILLNDIDHLLTVAQQQLQLSGNVSNAIIALETAQAQLARAGRPQMAALQQAINGDLDRLRAASTVDAHALSEQLEQLLGLIESAPMLVPDTVRSSAVQAEQPVSAEPASSSANRADAANRSSDDWWSASVDRVSEWSADAWVSIRSELGHLVDVRRVGDSHALLLSPEQAQNLRESLRLRVITARLALLMHQKGIWDTELKAVLTALETRFDSQARQVRRAIRITEGLLETPVDLSLPSIDNSHQALEVLRREAEESGTDTIPAPSQQPGPEAAQMLQDLKQDEALDQAENRAADSDAEQPGPEAGKMLQDLKQDEALDRAENQAADAATAAKQPGPEAGKMLQDLKQDEALDRAENQAADNATNTEQPGPEAAKMLQDLKQDEHLVEQENAAAASAVKSTSQE